MIAGAPAAIKDHAKNLGPWFCGSAVSVLAYAPPDLKKSPCCISQYFIFFLSCYTQLKLILTDVPGHDELVIISSGPLYSAAFLWTDKKMGQK